MSQPPVIHSSSTSSTRTSVLQRQCSLGGGGAAVVGHAGGVGRGDVADVGLLGDRDQREVEPVAAAPLSCISTTVPVLQSKPPSLLVTSR